MPIDMFPDDVLLVLERFDFYVDEVEEIEVWQVLSRVRRRWQSVIFGSRHHLNPQLVCTCRTPARDVLEI